eukprot:2887219-Amphidinium_carterae.1
MNALTSKQHVTRCVDTEYASETEATLFCGSSNKVESTQGSTESCQSADVESYTKEAISKVQPVQC